MNAASVESLVALLAGAAGGFGLWIFVTQVIDNRRPSLAVRVAPWVSDISADAHADSVESLARRTTRTVNVRQRVSAYFGRQLPAGMTGWLDGGARTRVVLAQAGSSLTREQWRLLVIEAGILGAISGAVVALLSFAFFHASLIAIVPLAVSGLLAGVWLRRWLLERAAKSRVSVILEELPAVCELLAICLTAGEGFREALVRVSVRGDGPLSSELRLVRQKSELGEPMVSALSGLSTKLEIAPLSRALDHIIAGIERGTPLAAILRTQASESRSEAGRRLQERASAREVVMLLPLVFLILPITIAFAVFPGLLVIQSGF